VDVWLCDTAGEPLDLSSPYAPEDPRSFRWDAPGLLPEGRSRRALLRSVLEAEGGSDYPSEYWRWRYGDQGWAYRGGHPHAVYGAVSSQEGQDVEQCRLSPHAPG